MNGLPEFRPRQLRERLAFLLYGEDALYHYLPVLRWLNPGTVDLVLYNRSESECLHLPGRLRKLPFNWYWGEELIQQSTGYRWLVSTHNYVSKPIPLTLPDGSSSAYSGSVPRMLGHYNIRFMYGLGHDAWNFADWNSLYETFLCFGPHQRKQFQAKGFRGQAVEMGFPRYDDYFNQAFDPQPWQGHFGCDPAKPTLLWFTTTPENFSTLAYYAEAISALSADYNVLVKPHPFSWERIPLQQEFLSHLPFTAVIKENINTLVLYQLADIVLSDYGGISFSALYTNKPLLLLDHPRHPGRASEALEDSDTDAWLRRHLRHIGPEDIPNLPTLLTDTVYWQAQETTRAWLRELFFTPNYGHSGQTAARLLSQPDKLVAGSW